ncbi:MAG: CD0415/CD1112 family protein [Clostridia bacterium]|nr:CD0415/CD1112 family protein [Clostridia bacterium]
MADIMATWLREMIDKLSGVGQNSSLMSTISGFNPLLYGYVNTISTSIIKPIAYSILGCFFLMELFQVSQKAESAGGGSMLGVRLVAKAMIKLVVCKTLVDSTTIIMNTVYQLSVDIMTGISGVVGTGSTNIAGIDVNTLTAEINGFDFGQQLTALIPLTLIYFAVNIAVIIVEVIVIGRFVELYIYIALAPIPIATFAGEELSQIAKGFLKNFAAVCLQGAIIYLVLSFFPVLVSTVGFAADSSLWASLWGLLFYTVVLVISVTSAGKISKSICNAM